MSSQQQQPMPGEEEREEDRTQARSDEMREGETQVIEESRDAQASAGAYVNERRTKEASLMSAFRDFFLAAFSDNYHPDVSISGHEDEPRRKMSSLLTHRFIFAELKCRCTYIARRLIAGVVEETMFSKGGIVVPVACQPDRERSRLRSTMYCIRKIRPVLFTTIYLSQRPTILRGHELGRSR